MHRPSRGLCMPVFTQVNKSKRKCVSLSCSFKTRMVLKWSSSCIPSALTSRLVLCRQPIAAYSLAVYVWWMLSVLLVLHGLLVKFVSSSVVWGDVMQLCCGLERFTVTFFLPTKISSASGNGCFRPALLFRRSAIKQHNKLIDGSQ